MQGKFEVDYHPRKWIVARKSNVSTAIHGPGFVRRPVLHMPMDGFHFAGEVLLVFSDCTNENGVWVGEENHCES